MSLIMAQQFINTLPEARDLPPDSTCMICLELYSANPAKDSTAESAVLLPCGHHVGAKCISNWLLREGANSCPHCRAKFFTARPRPYMEHGVMTVGNSNVRDRDERYPSRYIRSYPDLDEASESLREIAHRIDEAGGPMEEREGRRSSMAGGERSRHGGRQGHLREIYDHFLHRSPQEYAEILDAARYIERPDRYRYSPEVFIERIGCLATSFRLLPFRETLLYMHLYEYLGARIPRLETPFRGLSARQQEALFLELERRGAFNRVHHAYYRYRDGSNRERWRLHREKHGEVWSTIERRWY